MLIATADITAPSIKSGLAEQYTENTIVKTNNDIAKSIETVNLYTLDPKRKSGVLAIKKSVKAPATMRLSGKGYIPNFEKTAAMIIPITSENITETP